ncbi:MAG: SH3 domain-containing protein [Gammaproteobacteria bacterium]
MILTRYLLLLICLLWTCQGLGAVVTPSDRVTTRLNVRSAPSATAAIVGTLRPGEAALFLEDVPHWYRVRLDDGAEGFVSRAWSVKREAEYIRLGAWNLKKLGHGDAKDFSLVSQIINENFDLVAVIEVMQKQHVHPGYDALMQALGDGWDGLVTDTPRPNTGSGNAEYYAIAYRNSQVRPCTDWAGGLRYYPDNPGSGSAAGPDRFVREPAFACFEAGFGAGSPRVDFLLAAYHATWADGNEDEIVAEVSNLNGVFAAMAAARPEEKDLLIVGDFNLLPAILQDTVLAADRTEGTGSTLNSQGGRTANLYDHLLVHDEMVTSELEGNAVVLDRIGLAATAELFYQTVSDHLPIVVRLRSAGPDDD